MTTSTDTDPTRVSFNCDRGRHTRCLGVVANSSLNGPLTVPCECPTPDCGHGDPK